MFCLNGRSYLIPAVSQPIFVRYWQPESGLKEGGSQEHHMVRRKIKRKQRKGAARTGLQGEAKRVLEEALQRMNPRPDATNWKKMARGLASQKHLGSYFDSFVQENRTQVGWEWGTLWICHGVLCEAGLIQQAHEMYQVIVDNFPRDYFTEMARGRMLRDLCGEYFQARDHLRTATSLWPEGCEAYFQLGILYDLLGMPEFAFASEERAYQLADGFGDQAPRLRAQISFNQGVAMWQAARPYGDIKAYLRRALENMPDYDRAAKFLENLPDDDEADPRGRNAMQRFSDDMRKNMNRTKLDVAETVESKSKEEADA